MSYTQYTSALPFNTLSNYGARDILVKQPKLAPFMDSPFESVVKRNSNNDAKNTTNPVNFNDRKIKPTRGLRNTKPINIQAYLRRPVAFDKSPFERQIRAKQNFFNIENTRLDVDKYAEYLNAEMMEQNEAQAKEMQRAQMFLPSIIQKMELHQKQIQLGIAPNGSKPQFTPGEQAYLNIVGNLSPEELFAKFDAISNTQEALAPIADGGGEVKLSDDLELTPEEDANLDREINDAIGDAEIVEEEKEVDEMTEEEYTEYLEEKSKEEQINTDKILNETKVAADTYVINYSDINVDINGKRNKDTRRLNLRGVLMKLTNKETARNDNNAKQIKISTIITKLKGNKKTLLIEDGAARVVKFETRIEEF